MSKSYDEWLPKPTRPPKQSTWLSEATYKISKNSEENSEYILYLLCFLIILFLLRKLNISYMNIFLFAIGLIMSYYTIYSDKTSEEKIGLIAIIICIIVGPVVNETYNYYNNSRKKKKKILN